MKKLLLALAAILLALPAHAASTLYSNSSSVGIGTSSPTTGVALDVGSNTNSMLLPIGTTAQRPTGVAGMFRYNSTNSIPEFYISGWLPVPLTASSPLAINSTTGNITCSTCNTSAANVNSVSGDGALISNSASTGAVTLTLGTAAAYSVWGNNTASSAIPAYTTSPTLAGVITDTQSIAATSTDGLVLTDPTAATSGNQKWSPRIRWTGQGWKTNATAASQEVDAIAEIQPVQGTANPTFNWVLSGQVNGGGYGPLVTIPSGGGLNINSGVYQINGTQLAASNLSNGVNGSGSIVLTTSPTLTTPNIGAATGTSLIVPLIYPPSDSTTAIQIDKANGTSNVVNIDTTNGRVGIGTTAPGNPLSVNGIIESQTGGFKFPDGTTQTTAAAASGSVGMVLLATVNASNSASVSFGSSYLTSTYNVYKVVVDTLLPATNGVNFELQVSSDNGSTWKTSGYEWFAQGITSSTSASYVDVLGGKLQGSASPRNGQIEITFSNPSNANYPLFSYHSSFITSAGDFISIVGGGDYQTALSFNAIRLQFSSGNISTGNFHLYGLSGT